MADPHTTRADNVDLMDSGPQWVLVSESDLRWLSVYWRVCRWVRKMGRRLG